MVDISIDPPRCIFISKRLRMRTRAKVSARERSVDMTAIAIMVLARPNFMILSLIVINALSPAGIWQGKKTVPMQV
jgi:hypothetical protein